MTKIRSRSSSRVRDVRGSGRRMRVPGLGRGGGRGGGGMPLPVRAGGGIVGLIVVVAVVLLTQFAGDGSGDEPVRNSGAAGATCATELEQVVCGAVDDVVAYWEAQFPLSFQGAFPSTDTVFFSGAVSTACGQATASVGPFYCPADQLVYFDLEALADLQRRFGAGGDLAAQYIVAHEYGHHVQNVTGISDRMRQAQQQSPGSANELSVAHELQADCFAGAWATTVAERGLFSSQGEITEALEAAEAVGDDRIMEASGLEIDPEQFTHGTAEQRRTWFEQGYSTGDPESCRTFDGSLAP